MEKLAVTLGRCLLGLYFLMPGISKVTSYQAMLDYMNLHNIPMADVLLPITTALQILGGLCLIAGFRIKEMALMFAGMTGGLRQGKIPFQKFREGLCIGGFNLGLAQQ